MKKVLLFVSFVAVIGAIIFALNSLSLKNVDLTDRYEKTEVKASRLQIIEAVNVRSEPAVLSEKADGDTNSFGLVKPVTIDVTKFYETDKTLDANGDFYGFSVEEILASTEGHGQFPKSIKDDSDGIVWINAEYVKVQ